MTNPIEIGGKVSAYRRNQRIQSIHIRNPKMGEQWERINMGSLLYEPLHLHVVYQSKRRNRWVGVVSHYAMRRRFKLEMWTEDIAYLQAEFGIVIGKRYRFAEPVEISARRYIGQYFKGIDEIWNRTFKEIVQTMETPQPETAAPDFATLITQLTAMRDMLANSPTILGLHGDALTVATAKTNAAHYIGNAISSLQMALPLPLISGDDVTQRIPTIEEIEDAA
jgi:hypothetical protein